MLVEGLRIPDLLVTALQSGRWPSTPDSALTQNLHRAVPAERVRLLAAEESTIYLYSPPFHTVAQIMTGNGAPFYTQFGRLEQLDPRAAIEIGDFGLGSDAPILLDYRNDPTDPRVLRLRWHGLGEPNEWVQMAPDFATFMNVLWL